MVVGKADRLPQSFSNLVLRLEHPEYKAITYQQPVTNIVSSTNLDERLGAAVDPGLQPPLNKPAPNPRKRLQRVC